MSDATTNPPPALRRCDLESGSLRLGDGEIGGKAQGLVFFRSMLDAEYEPERFPGVEVGVPPFAVLTTEIFDEFLDGNGLHDLPLDRMTDEKIARAFQGAPLPARAVSFLQALLQTTECPLAIRSSSLLEDAIFHPLAGVYETKMIPNNQRDPAERLRKIVEAVRLVYASVFFRSTRRYLRAIGKTLEEEGMAVLVQEVAGSPHGARFYPHVSGVARSHNFYPAPGTRGEDGVILLALGLGKTIVDGGVCWTYSPARPAAPPPFGSVRDLLKSTQLEFWAVRLTAPDHEDPVAETEHLVREGLDEAEGDGVLAITASTYLAESDRIVPGTGPDGPRVLDFAPLLRMGASPFNDVLRELLAIGERAAGTDVEIEFALDCGVDGDAARLAFLQVRPLFVSHESVEIAEEEWAAPDLVLASAHVMGNGCVEGIRDIVHVKRDGFEAKNTMAIARDLEELDTAIREAGRPYLLIGFGRWGSSDPWLGVPVRWSSIAGAQVIVEASLPELPLDPSQGSHFFHNVASTGVAYLAIQHHERPGIDWDWLERQRAQAETALVRHVVLEAPLAIKVDGRTGRAVVRAGAASS